MDETTKIIELLENRDENALESISHKYGRLLLNIANNILNSTTDAEECVNDTLYNIWNSIPPHKPSSILAYACMITRRKAIDILRFKTAEKRKSDTYTVVVDELKDFFSFENELIDQIYLKESLNVFLSGLSPENRYVFLSRYFEFNSIDHIAKKLNMSSNSVNTRLLRMRTKLRNQLKKGGISI